MKKQFIYKTLSPCPYYIPQKNLVTIIKTKKGILFSRQYIDDYGEISEKINRFFDNNKNKVEIAIGIHWGCSGTMPDQNQIERLIEKITF